MDLAELLQEFLDVEDPRLLVGVATSDDAGIYALTEELALVQTVDVITPVSDDPYQFGQVAAANALSDVYAMGGKPLTALNLAFFPGEGVPTGVLKEILRGAHDKVREAGAVVVGGHTVRDDEVKFGLSVTGTCDPRRFLPNSGAKAGDRLVLTKPLGTGVLITARKNDLVDEAVIERVVAQMAALNAVAGEEAIANEAHGATDITGFGLGGHAREMAVASGVSLRFFFEAIPCYPESLEMIARGVRTGVTLDNRASLEGLVEFGEGITEVQQMLLFDPQTSGGLLVALPAEQTDSYVERLRERGVEAAVVGEVLEGAGPQLIQVVSGSGPGS